MPETVGGNGVKLTGVDATVAVAVGIDDVGWLAWE
jgi:hypothetical protein